MSDLSIVGRDFQVSEEPVGFVNTGDYAAAGAWVGWRADEVVPCSLVFARPRPVEVPTGGTTVAGPGDEPGGCSRGRTGSARSGRSR